MDRVDDVELNVPDKQVDVLKLHWSNDETLPPAQWEKYDKDVRDQLNDLENKIRVKCPEDIHKYLNELVKETVHPPESQPD